MLLAPGSISQLVRPLGCLTYSFVREGSADGYLGRDLDVVLPEYYRYMSNVCEGSLIIQGLKGYLFGYNYERRRLGTSLTLLGHNIEF